MTDHGPRTPVTGAVASFARRLSGSVRSGAGRVATS